MSPDACLDVLLLLAKSLIPGSWDSSAEDHGARPSNLSEDAGPLTDLPWPDGIVTGGSDAGENARSRDRED